MTVGKDVSELFPDVVKCIRTSNLELKKLVYLYIMNYAKTQPETAILSVNAFVHVRLTSSPPARKSSSPHSFALALN
jgi:AP-1 complex subunit beta-1